MSATPQTPEALAGSTNDPYRTRWALMASLYVAGLAAIVALPTGITLLFTEILIWSLYAASVNLLLTYGRLISFGQAAYFGLGAYGYALSAWWLDLPPLLALPLGPALASVAALIYGFLCVRLTRIYFAMLTLACAQITYTVIFKSYDLTGGDTGLTNFAPSRLGFTNEGFAILVLTLVVVGLLAMWRTVNSAFGLAVRSLGENSLRAGALGYSRRLTQLFLFTISGFWGGVSGALFAALHGNVFPDYADVGVTLDGLIMVILGGLGSFAGAIYGAILYKSIDNFASEYFYLWELTIGVVVVAIILASPSGFAGLVDRLLKRLRGRA